MKTVKNCSKWGLDQADLRTLRCYQCHPRVKLRFKLPYTFRVSYAYLMGSFLFRPRCWLNLIRGFAPLFKSLFPLVSVTDSFWMLPIIPLTAPDIPPIPVTPPPEAFMLGEAILIFWILGFTAYILLSSNGALVPPPALWTRDSPGAVPPRLASRASLTRKSDDNMTHAYCE